MNKEGSRCLISSTGQRLAATAAALAWSSEKQTADRPPTNWAKQLNDDGAGQSRPEIVHVLYLDSTAAPLY